MMANSLLPLRMYVCLFNEVIYRYQALPLLLLNDAQGQHSTYIGTQTIMGNNSHGKSEAIQYQPGTVKKRSEAGPEGITNFTSVIVLGRMIMDKDKSTVSDHNIGTKGY